jgi:hypothetical protein
MPKPDPKQPWFRPEVRLVDLPWGGRVEILSSELGRWGICNMGILSPPIAGSYYGLELGDLVLNVGDRAFRAPVLSLLLRPPAARMPFGPTEGASPIMQAMSSTFPLRGAAASPGSTVLLEHQLEVARGFDPKVTTQATAPAGGPLPFLVELAGVLAVGKEK